MLGALRVYIISVGLMRMLGVLQGNRLNILRLRRMTSPNVEIDIPGGV